MKAPMTVSQSTSEDGTTHEAVAFQHCRISVRSVRHLHLLPICGNIASLSRRIDSRVSGVEVDLLAGNNQST